MRTEEVVYMKEERNEKVKMEFLLI